MNNFVRELLLVDNNANTSGGNGSDNNVHFTVDELLDFSKEDETMTDAFFDSLTGNSSDSSTVTVVDSCNSSLSGGTRDGQFNGSISCRSFTESPFSTAQLCVPYDDLAELEWLSNFVEESFSSDDLHSLNFIPTTTTKTATAAAVTDNSSSSSATKTISYATNSSQPPVFPAEASVPGKARSKRSRAAPCDWSSRLLLLAPVPSSSTNNNIAINSPTKPWKTTSFKRREPTTGTPGPKCLHCGSETTPQWRTGPMGPKTLCNACGVRYKSGRLVPEYRPAASPTFVPSKHSNSHRKVMELRRQKEMVGQLNIFNASNGCDDFLIHHQHNPVDGPDFRNMI